MAKWQDLRDELKGLLGSDNVYYQPPESLKMSYPAIRFTLNDVYQIHADDVPYSRHKEYQIIVIDRVPDNPAIDKILDLPYASYERSYKADNLHHTVLTLYY